VSIRFQADADIDPDIGRGLVRRRPAVDWRPAQGFIADATTDFEVLRYAADDRRVLVTGDISTIPRHFATFVRTRVSPGVILIPSHISIVEAIERLLLA
jgi:predicted nuclease of predicted toxin-antitoxin system